MYCGAGLVVLALVSKIMHPPTNTLMCVYIAVGTMASASLASTLYYEITAYSLSPLQYPTYSASAAVLSASLACHVLGVLVLGVGLVVIRDYSLITLGEQHPLLAVAVLLGVVVDSRLIWLLSCGVFGLSAFAVKYCKSQMITLLKLVLACNVMEVLSQLVHTGLAINAITSSSTSRLLVGTSMSRLLVGTSMSRLLVGTSMSKDPYIELMVLGGVSLVLGISMCMMHVSSYFIEEVPANTNS